MFFRSDDPLRDFDRYDMAMVQREARLPVCGKCGKRIHDEIYFDINGDVYCEDCVFDEYGRSTQDYLRDQE